MASPLGEITLSLLLVLLTASGCAGRKFLVASGRDGWTVPDEPLEHFQIKDTLVIRYDKHVDAVLAVNKSHYDACNTSQPLFFIDLDVIGVVLDTFGYNYFISADAMRCQAGERLRVFVNGAPDNTPSAHPPPPPKPASSSSAPPPSTPKPAGSSSAPPPPPPKPVSTTPSSSSAVDSRAGVLACLVIGASAAIL